MAKQLNYRHSKHIYIHTSLVHNTNCEIPPHALPASMYIYFVFHKFSQH